MSRNLIFCLLLAFLFCNQDLYGQCDFITPPSVKKIEYADREVTFSNVTINGNTTTYLAVRKGEKVKISTTVQSQQKGSYCPGCIVQIYWGINGYTSTCAKSFSGYSFKAKKSSHTFTAPTKDGIYYITMGSSLEYSCKNSIDRPSCSPDKAFAVLKVGNPDPEQNITLLPAQRGSGNFLRATLEKAGCFGDLDKIAWTLDGGKLNFDGKREIPLTQFGTYQVLWSNCITSTSKSYSYSANNQEVKMATFNADFTPKTTGNRQLKTYKLKTLVTPPKDTETTEVKTFKLKTVSTSATETGATEDPQLETLMENNDNFVLENLIFDQSKSDIKAEARKELDKLAQIMLDHPSMKILLEGHTDKIGNSRKNQKLSENRVKSVKNYLLDKGVAESNIDTKGWGDQKPLVITQDAEEGKVNRRVEVTILSR